MSSEHLGAVDLFRRLDQLRDVAVGGPLRRRWRARQTGRAWPVLPGAYAVGDPAGAVAICTLTSNELIRPLAALPGVAIAGRVYTANLGIERIVVNLTANPRIRFLLLAGRESPIFQPGQTLGALAANGLGPEGRIIGAAGPQPVLASVSAARVAAFRAQVEVVDRRGELEPSVIAGEVRALLTRDPGPFSAAPTLDRAEGGPADEAAFVPIRPGGRRQPLVYDPAGFFVITVDAARREIVVRHYLADYRPAHELRGHSAEALLLGLLREQLVSQLSHAGYLGAELAKAEAALHLGLRYEQDQPLRRAT